MLPPLGPGVRLRIDSPGRAGTALIERIAFAPAESLPAPTWPPHQRVELVGSERLASGPLRVQVAARGFALEVEGVGVAAAHSGSLIGYVAEGETR